MNSGVCGNGRGNLNKKLAFSLSVCRIFGQNEISSWIIGIICINSGQNHEVKNENKKLMRFPLFSRRVVRLNKF